jgi:hypothetical protein
MSSVPAGPHRARRIVAAAAAAASLAVAVSCGDDSTGTSGSSYVYGTPVAVGDGQARSYVLMDQGKPLEFGIALSEAALTNLPTAQMMYEYLLPLPATNPTQLKLVELDWNPQGHPPPAVYTVPHFDFHFYSITQAERDAIDPADPDFQTKTANHPAAEFIAPGYAPDPVAVPHMGVHWTDPASPEFNGQPFTRTFIYGSWDGKPTFMEPMVTTAFLETQPTDTAAVPMASKHEPLGFYPDRYIVSWDGTAKEWRVALGGLTAVSQ